ncbi:MAG: hypothetical protein LBU79_09685, partial [Planctomycetota bacterium]|nr:hypothetical protein [Planctomycetota bacterium]
YILEIVKVAGGPEALEELFFIPILGQEEGKKMSATTIDDIKAQSMEEGRAIGKLECTKNTIGIVLSVRFGETSVPVQEKVLHCQDIDFLEFLVIKSMKAETLEEFKRHLNLMVDFTTPPE